MPTRRKAPTLMVSSSVYHLEGLLDQIYATLTGYGYTVWMSHKGRMPLLDPTKTAFENCLATVERCDVFLGIITPFYGTGRDGREISITHQEILKAVSLDKPRWFLVHDHVAFARQILKQYRFDKDGKPVPFEFKRTNVMDDIRVVEMFEAAMRDDLPLSARTGNWVQHYKTESELFEFLDSQFGDIKVIKKMLKEHQTP